MPRVARASPPAVRRILRRTLERQFANKCRSTSGCVPRHAEHGRRDARATRGTSIPEKRRRHFGRELNHTPIRGSHSCIFVSIRGFIQTDPLPSLGASTIDLRDCKNPHTRQKRGLMQPLKHAFLGILSLVSVHAFAETLKYENVPNFFDKTPGGQPQGGCHGGVAIDKAGNCYVTTDTPRGILVFRPMENSCARAARRKSTRSKSARRTARKSSTRRALPRMKSSS